MATKRDYELAYKFYRRGLSSRGLTKASKKIYRELKEDEMLAKQKYSNPEAFSTPLPERTRRRFEESEKQETITVQDVPAKKIGPGKVVAQEQVGTHKGIPIVEYYTYEKQTINPQSAAIKRKATESERKQLQKSIRSDAYSSEATRKEVKSERVALSKERYERLGSGKFKKTDFIARTKSGDVSVPGSVAKTVTTAEGVFGGVTGIYKVVPQVPVSTAKTQSFISETSQFVLFSPAMLGPAQVSRQVEAQARNIQLSVLNRNVLKEKSIDVSSKKGGAFYTTSERSVGGIKQKVDVSGAIKKFNDDTSLIYGKGFSSTGGKFDYTVLKKGVETSPSFKEVNEFLVKGVSATNTKADVSEAITASLMKSHKGIKPYLTKAYSVEKDAGGYFKAGVVDVKSPLGKYYKSIGFEFEAAKKFSPNKDFLAVGYGAGKSFNFNLPRESKDLVGFKGGGRKTSLDKLYAEHKAIVQSVPKPKTNPISETPPTIKPAADLDPIMYSPYTGTGRYERTDVVSVSPPGLKHQGLIQPALEFRQASSFKLLPVQMPRFKITEPLKTKQSPLTKIDQKIIQTQKTRAIPKQTTLPKQKIKQKVGLKQYNTHQRTQRVGRGFPKIRVTPPPRPPIKPPFPKFNFKLNPLSSPKKTTGYRAFIERRGKKKFVSGALPKGRALKAGQTATLKGLGATFGIEKIDKPITMKDIKFKPSKNLFRDYRIKKGKRIALNNKFIQRRGKRLVSLPEIKEIHAFKKAKPKRKKK